jgi:2-keto-3-deoxy-L-rhamnonate aldolase RhmA
VHLTTVKRILDCCKAHRVPVGIHTGGLDYTRRRLEAGFDFVTLGSDAGFMMQTVTTELAAARGTAKREREATGY